MKITMVDDTQIIFDCQKCEEMAQKIGQTSAALGGKPQLYTTDMSKVTSEDIFGK